MKFFAGALPSVRLSEITPSLIDTALTDPKLINSADGHSKSQATMHRLKATIRSFFAWAHESGLIESNPARSVTTKRLSRTPPAYLTEAEKRRLLKELHDRENPLAKRDRVIFELFLGTGIRLQELVNLNVDDVDLDGKHIRITGKGNIPQVKFLKSSLRSLLRSYLADRRHQVSSECRALFISSRGTRLCSRQIAERLSYWLGKAEIQKPIVYRDPSITSHN